MPKTESRRWIYLDNIVAMGGHSGWARHAVSLDFGLSGGVGNLVANNVMQRAIYVILVQ